MSYLELTPEDINAADTEINAEHHKLGQLVYSLLILLTLACYCGCW